MSERADGLAVISFASAVFFPLWAVVGYSHLEHWQSGPIADGWTEIVKPWGCVLWAGFLLFILSGWAAYSAKASRGLRGDFIYIMIGLLSVIMSALPGAVWLSRIGNIDLTGMVQSLILAAGIFTVPCMLGGCVARLVSPKVAHLFILATGFIALVWVRAYV